jgi:putative nucleotidyltransferase with HDIG domain
MCPLIEFSRRATAKMPQHEIVHESLNHADWFSQPAQANAALQQLLQDRESVLESIPSVPAILQTLLGELEQPPDRVDMLRVADLIGRDESITAQCLRMANSPLFSLGRPTDSIRAAVRTLGIARTRDIAVSCTIMHIGAWQHAFDPAIFWEHSLGVAMLSRKLARSMGFENPDQAYLAGLLHDIGYIVNLVLAPQLMKAALEQGTGNHIFIGEVEHSALGFTHCQSGEVLAHKWNFSPDMVEVIRCHHNQAAAVVNPVLVAIVSLTDRVCRSSSLGLGYAESPDPALTCAADWEILTQSCPRAAEMNWGDFVKDSDSYFAEIRTLVTTMFSTQKA